MTPLAVFLHTMLVVALGPVLAGLIRLGSSGGGVRALVAPARAIGAGLRAPGQPPLGRLALLSLAIVAGLLIPLFASDAVLGFLGDGFTALLLLTGLSVAMLPVRVATVLAVAAALWTMGALTGTTDLAQALVAWPMGPAAFLVFVGLALAVAPLMQPDTSPVEGLDEAVHAWTRSTLQLGWLALALMTFPVILSITGGISFAGALGLFVVKFAVFGPLLAALATRGARWPLAELGLACSLLALALVKLGI